MKIVRFESEKLREWKKEAVNITERHLERLEVPRLIMKIPTDSVRVRTSINPYIARA